MNVNYRLGMGVGAALAAMLLGSAGQAATLSGDEALRARYSVPASRFVEIDGSPIHYADEGRGPAIVLIHGSYASLRQWNGWVAALRRHYRVVRFDTAPSGLSGPSPDADYGAERNLRILEALRERLGVERFLLVATSSGAITGAAYAALHPEHLTGLILSDAAAGPLYVDRSKFPPALQRAVAADARHKGFHEPEFWKQILLHNVEDKRKVTPALVREWTALNDRALRMPPSPPDKPRVSLDRAPDDLARITAPTLLLWGAQDNETTVAEHGRKALKLLPARDKALIVVPRCGHMLPIDCGDRALASAMPFIRRVAKADR